MILLILCVTYLYAGLTSTLTENEYPHESNPTNIPPDDITSKKPDPCSLKSQLLDPDIIKSTNEKIMSCTERWESCAVAKNSKYRNINGTCNNLNHPYWGRSQDCFRRVLPHDYNDNTSLPRKSCTGKELPNPREVSNVFHKEAVEKTDGRTTHFMEWGQLVSHDLTLNAIIRNPVTTQRYNCCLDGFQITDKCMSFPIPPSETFYTQFGITCLNYARTMTCPHCKSGKRYHLNLSTAYHDLSLLYGSDEEAASGLRSFKRGMLKADYSCETGPMLPTVAREELCESPPGEERCYHSGDFRTNQTPFLLAVHTYLLRYHNFLCEELSKINSHWNDEELYQEARRINIAQAQYITYGEYLPLILGISMENADIAVLSGNQYTKYDSTLDASITDEYAAVAARYGHTLIPGTLSEIDPNTEARSKEQLRNFYYNPYKFPCQAFEKIAKGMTVDEENKRDQFLSNDVRDFLYRRIYLNEKFNLDLAALSIVRAREHGIPGYTYYLAHLFNLHVKTFRDLKALMPEDAVEQLRKIYDSVHDIDAYSAGLVEYSVLGGIVGPTFTAILGEQYQRTKFGDRYWFEHGNEAGSFTPDQLEEIKKSSLSAILCETTKMTRIQRNVFFPPSRKNPVVSCNDIHKFNLNLWKE